MAKGHEDIMVIEELPYYCLNCGERALRVRQVVESPTVLFFECDECGWERELDLAKR